MGEKSNPNVLTVAQSMDLAIQHHAAGRLSEAKAIYDRILEADSRQHLALHLLGTIAYQTAEYDTAVDLLTKAVAIKSDFAEAHNSLGVVFKKLGRLDEAVASFHKVLAIEPDHADALYNVGTVFQELGRLDEAATSYQKAVANDHAPAEAHNNLGTV